MNSEFYNGAFIRRLAPAIAALVFLIGLGGYLLCDNALKQDADVQDRARISIARTLNQVRDDIGRNMINYAKWGEAYKHLHLVVDKAWANDQHNVGDIPFTLYGYNGVFVVNPEDKTVYTVIDGQPSNIAANVWLQGNLDELLREARRPTNDEGSVMRILTVHGVPALVAAGTLTPGWDPSIKKTPGPASVLLFAEILNSAKLAQLSSTYGLQPLSTSLLPIAGQTSIPLLDSSMWVDWDPPGPGKALLARTLPIFGTAVLLLAAVLLALVRSGLKMSAQISRQMTSLKSSRLKLHRSQKRLGDFAGLSSDWLWEIDEQSNLSYLSYRFTQMTGWPRDAWLGMPLASLLTSRELALPEWLTQLRRNDAKRDSLICDFHDQGGLLRTARITALAIEGNKGWRGTASDITDEMAVHAEVLYLSMHDALTGLPNRHRLHEVLNTWLGSDRPRPVVALCLDLDRFKPVNDAFGHAVGDSLLRQVAERLRSACPADGIVARVGGDEFVAVFPDDGASDVAEICQHVLDEICRPFSLESTVASIGVSIGVAHAPAHTDDANELLRLADLALYQAKAAGRTTWRTYEMPPKIRLQVQSEC